MQPVLGLVPHRRLRAVDHLRRHLVAAVSGQAMHEDRVLGRLRHHLGVDLEGAERLLPLVCIVVAHRHPDIGHHAIGAARRLKRILAHLDVGALALRPIEQRGRRPERLRRSDPELEAEAGGGVHPGGGDIIGVADPGDCAAFDRPFQLLEGHHVGHHLAGMRPAGEPVDHRHGGVRGQLGQRLVRPGAQHDRVDIARQRPRGVGEGLAPAELHVLRIEHHRVAAELMHGDLERHPGAGRRLLEDHGEHGAGREPQALRRAALALDRRGHVDDGAQRLAVQMRRCRGSAWATWSFRRHVG